MLRSRMPVPSRLSSFSSSGRKFHLSGPGWNSNHGVVQRTERMPQKRIASTASGLIQWLQTPNRNPGLAGLSVPEGVSKPKKREPEARVLSGAVSRYSSFQIWFLLESSKGFHSSASPASSRISLRKMRSLP